MTPITPQKDTRMKGKKREKIVMNVII